MDILELLHVIIWDSLHIFRMRKTALFSTLIIMIMRKALSSGKIESKIYIEVSV